MRVTLVVVFLVLSLSRSSVAQELPSSACSIEKILWPQNDSCMMDEECLIRTVLNAGESALPILQKALDDQSEGCVDDRHETAANLVSIIGGIKAIDILQHEYQRSPDSYIERAICFAMGSTGRKEDLDFLLKSLTAPDPEYDRWSAVEAAAISLGILKYTPAIPLMNERLREDPTGLLGSTLHQTIDWLERLKIVEPTSTTHSDDNQIAHAIVTCCPLDRIDAENRYSDPIISIDRKRAFLTVMMGNKQYLYVLRSSNVWTVTGMARVAIYD